MNEKKKRVVSIGEVMIEMTRGPDGRFRQTCAGDTFNTAVYLARRGLPVAFASALGDDPYSDQILALAAAEGIVTELVARVPGRLPGLCLVETDPAGQHIRNYWRDGSPACQLFELPNWGRIAEVMLGARIIYFSGITLSIYSNTGLGRFLAVLETAREAGAKVVFDGNYRPGAWHGDVQRTRTVVETLSPATGARFSLIPPDNATGNFVKVVQRVPVKIQWTKPPQLAMRPGLSAEVTVHVEH